MSPSLASPFNGSGRRFIGNRLLDRLNEQEARRFVERAERVRISLRTVVTRQGEASSHVYFPLSAVFSALIPLQDGSAIEAGTTGNEGLVGLELVAESAPSVYQFIQQVEGESLRLSAKDFRELLAGSGHLAELLKRYTLTVLHQAGQTAACNVRHSVEERMCRWLLMTHDRVGFNEFFLTQEFLDIMLGVRRQSVSLAASTLQLAGLIEYVRGHMKILDREGLERSSCECYRSVWEMYERVMGPREV